MPNTINVYPASGAVKILTDSVLIGVTPGKCASPIKVLSGSGLVGVTPRTFNLGIYSPGGPPGLPGPTAISADSGNTARLGSDSLIYVPASGGGGGGPPGPFIRWATIFPAANWNPIGVIGKVLASLDLFNPGSVTLYIFIYDDVSPAPANLLIVAPFYPKSVTSVDSPITPLRGLYVATSSDPATFTPGGTFLGLLHMQ
jgi:hypothetical protein